MKIATITETKNRLSALLDTVRAGETVLIVDRGRPIARLESVVNVADERQIGRIDRLERSGLLRRARHEAPLPLLQESPPQALDGGSIVQVLLDEREESR